MSDIPFVQRAYQDGGLLHKVLNSNPSINAFIELNNTLAAATNLQEVTLDFIQELNQKYNTDLHRKFRRELESLYRDFLIHCLKDRIFTDEEIAAIWHLKALFGLDDADHERIYREVALATYEKDLEEALSDARLSNEEREHLQRLSAYLVIPEDLRKASYNKITSRFVQDKFDEFTADEELSPEEEAELQAISRSLGVELHLDSKSAAKLQAMRQMWTINSGPLPPVHIHLTLPAGEQCYYVQHADWYEDRRVTKRIGFNGPSLRIKIVKGVYWRAGNYSVQRTTQDVLTKIDTGVVYLTNKRLLFDGARKNQSIKLNKILDIIPYSNGVGIEKDGGKSPILTFKNEIHIFTAILARLIRDNE